MGLKPVQQVNLKDLLNMMIFVLMIFLAAPLWAQEKGWEKDWSENVQAAKREGRLTVYHTTGPFEPLLLQFQARYPEIRVTGVVGRGSQLAPRIMAERRAGRYLADVYLGAAGTPYRIFYPAKILEPVPPRLVLPEVLDKSKWFQGKHHYADPEEQYIFVYEGTVRSEIAYNRNLVNPKELKSYWDLLEPRWKGKMGAIDPKITGVATSTALAFFYYNSDLGPAFLRRLFGEMSLSYSSDTRQLADWLSVGRVAIAFFAATEVALARKMGLPVDVIPPLALKEGSYTSPRQGTITFMNRAPHPHAAKTFLNWLLSREGQVHFQKFFTVPEEEYLPSMRLDVPKDEIPAAYRLVEGLKLLPIYRPEYIDTTPARKVVEEVLGVRKR
jgi:iron(III) transport system substrate-binding protein